MAANSAQADDSPPELSKQDLLHALADTQAPELKEMAKRLVKSQEDMRETIVDLEAEQKSLKEENEHMRETIELMMKEMQKLQIGAFNTVEPEIEGGPLEFVARYWERVRPRDTAVQIDEHTGEIKKPALGESGSPSMGAVAQQLGGQLQEQVAQKSQQALELGKQATEQGKQVWGRFSQSFGPLWQRAESLLAEGTASKPKSEKKKKKRTESSSSSSQAMVESGVEENSGVDEFDDFQSLTQELSEKISFGNLYIKNALTKFFEEADAMLQPEQAVRSQFLPFDFRTEGSPAIARIAIELAVQKKPDLRLQVIWNTRRSTLTPAEEGEAAQAAAPGVAATAAAAEPSTNGGGGYADAAAPVAPAPQEAAAATSAEAPPAATPSPPVEVPATGPSTAAALRAPGAEEQISSTILIEAQLKIDDGSVHTLQVRAADRCKEVAHRFVQEHSLKAWFEDPLTAWLKKVEADADKFPVTVEGDLMEIRKAHSKSK